MTALRTRLFRAVTFQEVVDISRLRRFRNPDGIETKYFAETLEGGEQYARLAEIAFGEGPFAIVSTAIDTDRSPAENRIVVDGGRKLRPSDAPV